MAARSAAAVRGLFAGDCWRPGAKWSASILLLRRSGSPRGPLRLNAARRAGYDKPAMAMSTQLLSSERREFTARALLIGQRIDLRALGSTQRLGGGPLAISVRGGGAAILFRYGAVVLFDVEPLEQDEFLRQLEHRVQAPDAER